MCVRESLHPYDVPVEHDDITGLGFAVSFYPITAVRSVKNKSTTSPRSDTVDDCFLKVTSLTCLCHHTAASVGPSNSNSDAPYKRIFLFITGMSPSCAEQIKFLGLSRMVKYIQPCLSLI